MIEKSIQATRISKLCCNILDIFKVYGAIDNTKKKKINEKIIP